jgi:hypothetical protein
MLCSRGGPTMMARIGVMRALNRHVERVFNPDRKDTHWGNGSSRGTSDGQLSKEDARRMAQAIVVLAACAASHTPKRLS